MITHLISTTKFVKLILTQISELELSKVGGLNLIMKYVNFISQKPIQNMFIGKKPLFKGWSFHINSEWEQDAITNGEYSIILGDTVGGYKSIEILASKIDLELTETGLKQIGLC